MKKFFALALICALVLALVPSVALAAGVATVNGVEYSDIQEAITATHGELAQLISGRTT